MNESNLPSDSACLSSLFLCFLGPGGEYPTSSLDEADGVHPTSHAAARRENSCLSRSTVSSGVNKRTLGRPKVDSLIWAQRFWKVACFTDSESGFLGSRSTVTRMRFPSRLKARLHASTHIWYSIYHWTRRATSRNRMSFPWLLEARLPNYVSH